MHDGLGILGICSCQPVLYSVVCDVVINTTRADQWVPGHLDSTRVQSSDSEITRSLGRG